MSLIPSFPVPRLRRTAAFRHILRFALTQLAVSSLFAQSNLTLRVASETGPAGGWAQIKVYADQPALIASGVLALDLDPRMFGPIESVAAFSATGDAIGSGFVSGTHAEIGFRSPSGGIGQLPGTPVIAVRAPILSNAPSDSFVALSLPDGVRFTYFPSDNTLDVWTDPQGAKYQVNVLSGRYFTGSELSVRNVTPSGGLLPVGTVLQIEGTGFSVGTKVTADGLAFSSLKVVSPTKIEATLASSAELTGIRFHFQNPTNEPVDFFPAFASAVQFLDNPTTPPASEHVILPLTESKTHGTGGDRPLWSTVLLNPTQDPVQVRVLRSSGFDPVSSLTYTVPPGGVRLGPAAGGLAAATIQSDTPLRMATRLEAFGRFGVQSQSTGGYLAPLQASFSYPQELTVDCQTGTSAPAQRTIRSTHRPNIQELKVAVDAGSWLHVVSFRDAQFIEHTLNFDPTGLAPGKYTGTITVTPVVPSSLTGFPVVSATFKVTLNISAQPTLLFERGIDSQPSSGTQLSPASWKITSNGTPASVTARITSSPDGNWLTMDKTGGTTPETLNFTANPTGLARGSHYATITVEGPNGPQEVQVGLVVIRQDPPTPLTVFPLTQTVVREAGAPADTNIGFAVAFSTVPPALSATRIETTDGGNWLLSAGSANAGGSTSAAMRIDPSNLAPGTYTGSITGVRGDETATSRVTLTVVPKPTRPLSTSPASLVFTAKAGVQSDPQPLAVGSPDGTIFFSWQTSRPEIAIAVNGFDSSGVRTPAVLAVTALFDSPGTYYGSISLSTSAGTIQVPFAVYVTATADRPPTISSVTNSASNVSGRIAPGELITLRGTGLGSAPTGLTLDASGKIRSDLNADTRVLLNGTPAPILYTSPEQWNVIAPYELHGSNSALLKVISGGIESKSWTVPVGTAAPGIFTVGSTGVGQGAVLNQDNTVNSPSNPAVKGTVIQIYATGGGQTTPFGITGSVTPSNGGGSQFLRTKVRLDGYDAPVTFAGPAPGFAAGVLQVNAVVPAEIFGRANVPLVVEVDGALSAPASIAIR
ncbi:MAG: hypothetical protein ABIR70_01410 [Bryobacteraceae bacterium]